MTKSRATSEQSEAPIPADDLLAAWNAITKALHHAFFYDNQLPIYELTNHFDTVLTDCRDLHALQRTAKSRPLSVKEQVKFEKLLRKDIQSRLAELSERINLFRAEWRHENHPVNDVIEKLSNSKARHEWHQEQSAAKDKALADANSLCQRLLQEFQFNCP